MSDDSLRAEAKLQRAASRLGLTFLQVRSLIVYDPQETTASWRYHRGSGKESIHVGPEVTSLELDSIEMVLRHEFLHRSTYHGFRERYENADLANIVQDVCINRLLCEAYPDKMRELSLSFYPAEAKRSVIALADCSADPAALPPNLADLWRTIWETDEHDAFRPLNPASLYYRLLRVGPRIPQHLLVYVRHGQPGDRGTGSAMPGTLRAAEQTVLEGIGHDAGSSSSTGRTMSEYFNVPVRMGADRLIAFLDRIEADRIASDLAQPLRDLVHYTMNQPFAGVPTPRGLTMIATGLSDIWQVYHNRITEERPRRLAIGMYIDVSGSMTDHFAAIHTLAKAVVTVPLVIRVFDVEVREVTPEQFLAGEFEVGGGTEFDPVVEDILDDDHIGSALILTDGNADLDPTLSRRLGESSKRVYLVHFGGDTPSGPLRAHAVDWLGA